MENVLVFMEGSGGGGGGVGRSFEKTLFWLGRFKSFVHLINVDLIFFSSYC